MIGLPPSAAGAVQLTLAEALPAIALTALGAAGAVAGATGVTLVEAADAGQAHEIAGRLADVVRSAG